ncbi:MAG: hypothetical protein ACD_76C00069G0006 [uncultured bacterium]|nr:MAG: hypothetical protein ACD_76C00069G0006 [uncultured bacterium]HBD05124.1 hypothetical protein [Candidatus Uhrbacteria bacterium]
MNKTLKGIIFAALCVFALLFAAAVFITTQNKQGPITTQSFDGISDSGMATGSVTAEMPFFGREESVKMIAPFEPPTAGDSAATADQKIIKTANLSVVVKNVTDNISRIATIAESKSGYVQFSSVYEQEDGSHTGSITVRVPVDQFDASMKEIKALADVVETESVNGQDVTEQYTDLEARLRNAKAQEVTFLSLLDKATRIEDILAIQRELSNVRLTIESLEGQIKYLENTTSYATISVSLSEVPVFSAPTKTFRFMTIIKEAGKALVEVLQVFATLAIWFVIIGGGVLVPLGLVAWALYAIIKRVIRRMNK